MDKIFSLLSGIIFGIGLMISGMTNPEKVIGFLSLTHNWDASLIFVMGGGILFTPVGGHCAAADETDCLFGAGSVPGARAVSRPQELVRAGGL